MSGPMPPDAPRPVDVRRLTAARTAARRRIATLETFNVAVRLDAFRTEVGGVVRSASPFLVSLLETKGTALDDVVDSIGPPLGWPRRPRLSPLAKVSPRGPHFLRLVSSGLMPYDWPATGPGPQTAVRFDGGEDGEGAAVRIEAHSVEVSASVGGVGFRTRFGLMEISLQGSLPVAVVTASVGRLVEEVVDHPALAGRGWVQKPLAADFIAYAHAPAATCVLLPVPALQRAWRQHGPAVDRSVWATAGAEPGIHDC